MFTNDINLINLLIASVAAMLIGFIWYGPLFGKEWMALMKIKAKEVNKSKENMPLIYAQAFGLAFLQAFVLDTFLTLALGFTQGASRFNVIFITVSLIWIGFVAVPKYHDVIFEGKRKKLFAIDAGYQLANMLIMGLIVGAW